MDDGEVLVDVSANSGRQTKEWREVRGHGREVCMSSADETWIEKTSSRFIALPLTMPAHCACGSL